jgi:hypothetical protein
MAQAMSRFERQVTFGVLFLAVALAVVVILHQRYSAAISGYYFLSGWILFAAMIFLAAYNLRKKFPFLPLGSSEAWLQGHIYVGFFTVALFLSHTHGHWPRGWFEIALTVIYAVVMVSGMAGLALTRIMPRRMTARGGEVLYEKIPMLRHHLRVEAEGLAIGSGAVSPALAEFYVKRLNHFFSGSRHFAHHLLESRRPTNTLLTEMADVRRYLAAPETAILDKLLDLVRQKDALDYHYAAQTALRLWLFTHLPLTYSLLLFILVHIALVYAFSGGLR